jgi:hypothetical protein
MRKRAHLDRESGCLIARHVALFRDDGGKRLQRR